MIKCFDVPDENCNIIIEGNYITFYVCAVNRHALAINTIRPSTIFWTFDLRFLSALISVNDLTTIHGSAVFDGGGDLRCQSPDWRLCSGIHLKIEGEEVLLLFNNVDDQKQAYKFIYSNLPSIKI